MNNTPRANRPHIAFFGVRNAGKSSLINAVTGQDTAIVSDIKGTTTDPVYKAMELLPLGAVVLIDTPGFDDEGELGDLRVRRARQTLNKADAAVLVTDGAAGFGKEDEALIDLFKEKGIPFIIAINKNDLTECPNTSSNCERVYVSAKTGEGVHELKERLARLNLTDDPKRRLVADLVDPGDFTVLVVPIDSAAPKGRLILPQQQVIRDALEAGAAVIVVKESELRETLENLGRKPKIVITDSQAFEKVSAETPSDIALTSFSILFARYKGVLEQSVQGVEAMETVSAGDKILIAEGCTHHRQCDDIGTVKLPRWIRDYTGKNPEFSFVSGSDFPDALTGYKLIVHCGGCMLNNREMRSREERAAKQGAPFTNYGVIIAYTQGILERCTSMFS
ncbi:MAG: [FeFe] hydrogenase H-cluster maturation GTPase HydF [Clostridiales bacterium]|jgi:[FeFe] hydrogenase H-cluster maturation GTPase HydF|nr:[FeFe] hydrogenase H-cluster maturation GTPase HydF [Clostridiales bacterium]